MRALTVSTAIPPWLDVEQDIDLIVDAVRELAGAYGEVRSEPELIDSNLTREGPALHWLIYVGGPDGERPDLPEPGAPGRPEPAREVLGEGTGRRQDQVGGAG